MISKQVNGIVLAFVLSIPLQSFCQDETGESFLKMGLGLYPMIPKYSYFNLHFYDSSSNTSIQEVVVLHPLLNLRAFDLGLFEIIQPKGLIINPVYLSIAARYASFWLEVGTGVGYQLPFFKKHIKRWKLRTGIQLSYSYYELPLKNSVHSGNNRPIIVDNKPISDLMHIHLVKKMGRLAPTVSLAYRLNPWLEVRFAAFYNDIFASKEFLTFFDAHYHSKYSPIPLAKVKIPDYLSDDQGAPLHGDLLKTDNLFFKIEAAFSMSDLFVF